MRVARSVAMLAVMQQTWKENRAVKRPRRSKSEWVEEVGLWRRSGQSAVEYASEHGLHPGTLAVWGSRIGHVEAPKTGASRSGKVRFLPVRVAEGPCAEAAPRGEVEVLLLNGRCVRIRGEFQNEAVARLLDLAERGGRC